MAVVLLGLESARKRDEKCSHKEKKKKGKTNKQISITEMPHES